jgi:hypothetical protein
MNRRLAEFMKLACLLAMAAGTAPAFADAILYTPPISKPPRQAQDARCAAVNTSDRTRTLTIEAMIAGRQGPGGITVQVLAGDSIAILFPACEDGCEIYCRFVIRGDRQDFRASICDSKLGCLAAE